MGTGGAPVSGHDTDIQRALSERQLLRAFTVMIMPILEKRKLKP